MLQQSVREYLDQAGIEAQIAATTPLIGPDSAVDSLGLVMIVTGFEMALNETFETDLVLANDKAMSMKRSPFRTMEALTDYAAELLEEAGAA